MEQLAAALGVSIPVFRFLVAFLATIPCSWLCRFIPGTRIRHLYSTLTGCFLSHYAFGWDANLHFAVPMLIGYSSMLFCRRYCGSITFIGAFAFLIGCHVYYMSGDAWKEGGIDCTGALMVLTLKVVSAAMNYQDGLLKEEQLRPAQKKNRILSLPSLDEYTGFCFCCGTHLAGPVYEIQDYLDWTADKGLWSSSQRPPSPYGGAFRAFLQAIVCMVIYTFLTPRVPVTRIFEPQYSEWGFWKRWGYQWLTGFTARWKYYFIWSISESAVIISGLGFSGWSESQPTKPKWDRAKNVDIVGVELAESSAVLPLVWNIHVSTWLRLYVYERVSRKGRKAGFFELLATQIVSAVWHGLYAGYILFFINSALMIAGSRVIYRWQQAVPENLWFLNKIIGLFSLFYTAFALNYSCIGFIVCPFPSSQLLMGFI
ncbi:hypothetical protein KP509_01G022300 [Ceratopteris richardii]|uniref:Uncharacterized protein n=1 Tax=Ceratopteris richardii TaxID=49495 RepID=A0A8T2VJI7_CERRI|nr:hypothetical protein KP509_01G022300 [Ceratopteris richardii]